MARWSKWRPCRAVVSRRLKRYRGRLDPVVHSGYWPVRTLDNSTVEEAKVHRVEGARVVTSLQDVV